MRIPAIAAVLCLAFGAAAQAAEVPELTGTWNGAGPAVSNEAGWQAVRSAIMTICEQRGLVFRGQVQYEGGEDEFVGIVKADGKTVLISDDDGLVTATLTSPGEMELCYIAGGDEATAACLIMKRAE